MTRDFSFLLAVKTLNRSRMNVVNVLGLQTGYVDPRPHWIVPPSPHPPIPPLQCQHQRHFSVC